MESDASDTGNDLVPITPIRIETATTRFPIHRLAKHGDITIDIREDGEDGEAIIRWEVSYNSKYGQPGPLAYKLDTVIINRRIEEAARPIPRIIRLGSLREIAEELGYTTHDTNMIKNALYQNAGAFITAKTSYRQSNGKSKKVEIGDTRYGVVFTGEKLPDDRIADGVYIVLHDFYMEILNNAVTRPLDYDYLRPLAPTAQRLYELLSYHIYAALKYDRSRAKLVYSEFCTYAPQTRYVEFDKVKKQMYKINSVHKKAGYIAKVDFNQTTDKEGQPDWIMLYMPGLKADAEFRAFTKRSAPPPPQIGQDQQGQEPQRPALEQLQLKLTPPRKSRKKPKETLPPSPLLAELVKYGVTAGIAAKLVESHPERIALQIAYLEWEKAKKPGKIKDDAPYLVKAIERNNNPPRGFVSKEEQERRAELKRQTLAKASADERRQMAEAAKERALAFAVEDRRRQMTPADISRLEAQAIASASEEMRQRLHDPSYKTWRGTMVFRLTNELIARMIEAEKQTEPA